MNPLRFIFIFFLICFFGFYAHSNAIDSKNNATPVDIQAEKLWYNQSSELLYAQENARVNLQDFQISADVIWLDTRQKVVVASGNVSLAKEGEHALFSDTFFYEITSENAKFYNLASSIENPGIKGTLYLVSEELERTSGDIMEGENGSITTCEYGHYKVVADRFMYYPDSRVEGYNIKFLVAGVPIFWSPYYVFWLDEQIINTPVIGDNKVEGWFIKTGHNYRFNKFFGGVMYLDYMEKKSYGLGFNNNYLWDHANKGTAYFYMVNEKDTGENSRIYKIQHQTQLNKTVSMDLKYNKTKMYLVPSGRKDSQLYSVGVKETTSNVKRFFSAQQEENFLSEVTLKKYDFYQKINDQEIDYSYSNSLYDTSQYLQEIQQLKFSQTFFSDIKFRSKFDYYKNGKDTSSSYLDEKLWTEIDINHSKSKFYQSVVLEMKFYDDLDQDIFQSDDNYSYLETVPAVKVNLKQINLFSLDVRSQLGLGRYHEVKYLGSDSELADVTKDRYWSILTFIKKYSLNSNNDLLLQRQYEQYLYSDDLKQFVISDKISISTKASDFFSNDLTYQDTFYRGDSPFYFDKRGNKAKTLSEYMCFFQAGLWEWKINTGYNFLTEKYNDIITNLTITPYKGMKYSFSTGYILEQDTDKFRDFIADIHLNPSENYEIKLNAKHNFNTGQLKDASSLVDFSIGEDSTWENKWRFVFQHYYDNVKKRFELRTLEIVKDLHCWNASFRYDEFKKEYLLVFTLKAWDEVPLKFKSSEEGFKFETQIEERQDRL